MSSPQLHRTAQLTDQVEYAYAASVVAERIIFTAGACPLDQDGAVNVEGFAAQARLCMENLAVALKAANSDLQHVLKTTVFVASSDRQDLVEAWREVRTAMAAHDAPSTLLGVAVLGYPGQLVEVEAVAVSAD